MTVRKRSTVPITEVDPDPDYDPEANTALREVLIQMERARAEWDGRGAIDPWPVLRWRIRFSGDQPSEEELLSAMRIKSMPEDLLVYVVDRLRARPLRGRPPKRLEEKRVTESKAVALAQRVKVLHAALRIRKARAPRKKAVETIAKREHMAERTLLNKIDRLSPSARQLIPSLALAMASLRSLEQQKAIEITDEGARWLPIRASEPSEAETLLWERAKRLRSARPTDRSE